MKRNFIIALLLLSAQIGMSKSYTLTIVSNPGNSSFRCINDADLTLSDWRNGMIMADWTSSSVPHVWRSLLRFDLSSIPAGSVIDSAYLSVYADSLSPSGLVGSPTYGTNNAVGIYRLTSTWDTATVSWLTQPGYTATDSVILPQSTDTVENYVRIDVSGLVKDAYTYGNYGFLFKELQETTPYNSMIFFSPYSYATNSSVVPTLVIKYRNTTAVANVNGSNARMSIYPNPCSSNANIEITDNKDLASLQVRDMTGKIVFAQQLTTGNTHISLRTDSYSSGVYFVSIQTGDGNTMTQKLVVR